jgi:hypothetical protein
MEIEARYETELSVLRSEIQSLRDSLQTSQENESASAAEHRKQLVEMIFEHEKSVATQQEHHQIRIRQMENQLSELSSSELIQSDLANQVLRIKDEAEGYRGRASEAEVELLELREYFEKIEEELTHTLKVTRDDLSLARKSLELSNAEREKQGWGFEKRHSESMVKPQAELNELLSKSEKASQEAQISSSRLQKVIDEWTNKYNAASEDHDKALRELEQLHQTQLSSSEKQIQVRSMKCKSI